MEITHYPLPQNIGNLPLPFFGGNYPIFSWIIFINYCKCIFTVSPGQYLLIIIYVIQTIRGNNNSPNSLNVMVNYHYHSEKRVVTQ